jgi:DNA-binding NarL/FixJ family response regulator
MDFQLDKLNKINVIIADDHPIFREGLLRLLKKLPYIDKIVEANNGVGVMKQLKEQHADLVLLDIHMPIKNGVETLIEIKQLNSAIKVIALSMSSSEEHIFIMQTSGVDGYLLKNVRLPELKRAIENVMEGTNYFTPVVANILFKPMIKEEYSLVNPDLKIELTEREKGVLVLICEQYSSSEIAEKLDIAENTVKRHRNALMEKTGSKNLGGLVLFAVRTGLYKTIDKKEL